MKKNHFMRIFITYALIVFGGSILIGLFSIQLFKISFLNAAQTKTLSNINLIISNITLRLQSNEGTDFNQLAKQYSENVGYIVNILDVKGNVIGEKVPGVNRGLSYNQSEEVLNSSKGKHGYSFRYDENLKVDVMYAAAYIEVGDFKGYIHTKLPMNEMRDINRGILSYSLIGVIFVLISSGILTLFFEKDILDPLKKLMDNSQDFAKGKFDTRVDIVSEDTIGILAKEYNSMLDDVQKHISLLNQRNSNIESGLEEVNVGFLMIDDEHRIAYSNKFALEIFESKLNTEDAKGHKVIEVIKDTEINNLIREVLDNGESQNEEVNLDNYGNKVLNVVVSPIANANDEKLVEGCFLVCYDITHIKKIEQMGSDFVSNSTHELRTPLTSIKGFVETLKDGAIENKEVAYKFLGIIEAECERLASLINDILQLSEIQNMKRDVNLGLYYIQDIIPEVIVFLENQIKKREMNVEIDIQKDIPLMLVNKDRLKQALINIIDNAVKYTQKGGRVKVKVREWEKNVIISVKDNGIGIPENSLPRLFERFYRVDKGRSRSQGGTGLGLSIVKNIVELYNGSIEVKSEVEKGTEFIIKIPIRIA